MQKVRFLIPFLIFLVLFIMTSGFCYYFFNEKIQIIEKEKAVDNAIGTVLPTTYSPDSEKDDVELSIKSSLFIRTVNLRKKLESIENKTGFSSADADKIPAQITREGDKAKANLNTIEEKMKKPAKRINYEKDLEKIYSWITAQEQLLKKFNNIKSQHFVDYGQFIGLDIQTQIAKSNGLIASLKQTDIGDAINAFKIFFQEAENVTEKLRRDEIDAINNQINDIETKAQQYVLNIQTALNEYAAFVNKSGLKLSDLIKSRELILGAYSECVSLVRTLSTLTTTINDEQKTFILPKIAESKARNEASELLVLLHPNDNAFFKRIYTDGIIQPGVNLPQDEFNVANLEFAALIADSMMDVNSRRFRTNPAYQAGINLESIVEAQTLTINTLVEMNKMLKLKLLQVFKTNDKDVPLPSAPLKQKNQLDKDITETNTTLTSEVSDRITKLGAETEKANVERNEILRLVSDLEDMAEELRESLSRLSEPFKKAIREHKKRLVSLEKNFLSLKGKIADDIKSEGKLRPSQGADGVITFTDRLNKNYNINLGKADKIAPGMRFIVYNEVGGETNVKGLLEVLVLRQDHYATCGLIIKYPGTEILKGDKISNPFFRKVNGKAEFLTVAFIGKFEPPESNVSNAQMLTYLTELGVKVVEVPTSTTDLIILSKPISKLATRTSIEKHYMKDLRPKIAFDEIEVKDILIYFHDQ